MTEPANPSPARGAEGVASPQAGTTGRNLTVFRNVALALLTLIMVFNYVDRLAIGILLQDIKKDLALSDTQLGVLTGIAFAAFYATMGIPIARWADRGNRVTIISVTVALWSVAVSVCGLARNFVQMLLMRVCVAVGEAGCHPPAFSLLADYFPRDARPRAIARYMLGWPLALLIGNFAAGWLAESFGWRRTMMIIGAPGLVLALLAVLLLREPRRHAEYRAADAEPPSPPQDLRKALATLWGSRSYRHLLMAFALTYFFANGITQWQPAFFIRSFGMSTGELGTWFAVIYGFGGLLGGWGGGELAAKYAAGNERLQMRGIAVCYCVLAVIGAATYLAPTRPAALVAVAFYAVGTASVNGPLFSATQALVPPSLRATSIAVILFFSNLVGLGLGPLTVGAISDALRSQFGEDSLRYALLIFAPGFLWAAAHMWAVSHRVMGDIAKAQAEAG